MCVFNNFTREDLGWAFDATEPNMVTGVTTSFGLLLMVLRFAGSPHPIGLATRGRQPSEITINSFPQRNRISNDIWHCFEQIGRVIGKVIEDEAD
jgi:hypothetical protein